MENKNHFDYIICGGGASGLMLMRALCFDPFFDKKKILLLEKESKNTKYKQRNILVWNEVAPFYHKRWARKEIGPFNVTNELIKLSKIKSGDNQEQSRRNKCNKASEKNFSKHLQEFALSSWSHRGREREREREWARLER